MIKGYARVSTDGQDLATQHELLKEAGATLVFSEKQSGIKTDRAALARCLASLEPGDVMLVTKLDRLARSTRDLLNTLATISEAGASFKSLGDPWADTTTPHGRLMLTVLGGLAEFERHLILSRTNEGRIRAKARGIRFGRKPKLTKHQQAEPRDRLAQGETLVAIARSYNVSHMTISRLAGVTFMRSARQTTRRQQNTLVLEAEFAIVVMRDVLYSGQLESPDRSSGLFLFLPTVMSLPRRP